MNVARWILRSHLALASLLLTLQLGCAVDGTRATHDPAKPPPPTACCHTASDVVQLDGRTVSVKGVYRKTRVRQRPTTEPLDLSLPGPAQVVLDSGVTLMLGIYYRPAGQRSTGELQSFHGRRVRVRGVLHRQTPPQRDDGGGVLATLIAPYLDVQAIELAE